MRDKSKNIENKSNVVNDEKKQAKKKSITMSHKEILKANGMEEPDIWNLPKE
ncbi:hypothetical protein [Flavobacterium sp.]|jgi:hypothetical protein|uniref:hypothetical protein n=1 Tax=Flavobacterium sp. TaxID=239 RepID=UPI0037BE4C3F